MSTGRILLAATPIGDPEDASPRLRRLLGEADVIAAEDTRRVRRLLQALEVQTTARIVSHFEHNEEVGAAELVRLAAEGALVVVVSDAGMPTVSDPGLRVVRAAHAHGVPVSALPGPSAVLTALALSGLATDRFCFEGFLPRGGGPLRAALQTLAGEPRTVVAFESPRRLAATLQVAAEVLGPERPAAVCRELTKTHEQVLRGTLAELVAWASETEVLGEITIVWAPAPVGTPTGPQDEDVEAVRRSIAGGLRLKDAVTAVAVSRGLPKRALYDAVVQAGAGGAPRA